MKKALVAVLVTVILTLVGLLGFVAMQPSEIRLTRTIEVDAAPQDVAAFATDLRKVWEWSPWRDIDPNLTSSYSDPSSGVGAWYAWSGNDEAGEGKQTVLESEDGRVVHDLHFIRPFEDHATATLTWEGTTERTTVSWSFHQEAGLGTKTANLVMDIEGMLGNDFQRGLDDLKPLVETVAQRRRTAEKALKASVEARRKAADADVP